MIIGFITGVALTAIVWYVKDYCMDSQYCKGYKRGYDKGLAEMEGQMIHDGLVAGMQEGEHE